jgi:hypothetical protein
VNRGMCEHTRNVVLHKLTSTHFFYHKTGVTTDKSETYIDGNPRFGRSGDFFDPTRFVCHKLWRRQQLTRFGPLASKARDCKNFIGLFQ